MKETVHEKAIRLIEGGIVNVDGHFVRLIARPYIDDPCYLCSMDCLCHIGNEMCSVCVECESITRMKGYLIFAYLQKN